MMAYTSLYQYMDACGPLTYFVDRWVSLCTPPLSFPPPLSCHPLPPHPQDEFELVGTILGLACYNGIIVDAHLPLPAYKKLMGLVSAVHCLEGRGTF